VRFITENKMKTFRIIGVVALSVGLLAGCGDDPPRSAIGNSCSDDTTCGDAICLSGVCVDPEGDEDQDGLSNRVEVSLQTNPSVADSDGDGKSDAEEVDGTNHIDRDGDGKPDALESAIEDADGDCLADEVDPDDATDLGSLVRGVCGDSGPCATAGIQDLTCDGATLTCDYSGIAGYSADDVCDGEDNDCDGVVDEDGDWGCFPAECLALWYPSRDIWIGGGGELADGTATLDPSGPGGSDPMVMECLQSAAGGGWTRLTDDYRAALWDGGRYRYLFVTSEGWMRTGVTGRWDWEANGTWDTQGPWVEGVGMDFGEDTDCGEPTAEVPPVIGPACAREVSVFVPRDAPKDAAAGTVTLCLGDPTNYALDRDCKEVAVYVQTTGCTPDEGSVLANGELEWSDGGWLDCWYTGGSQNGMGLFESSDELPLGDAGTSLKITSKPEAGELEVGLWSNPQSLFSSRAYRLTFDAKAAVPHELVVVPMSWREGIDGVYHSFGIPASWGSYEIGFVPGRTGARYELQTLLAQNGQVWMDNIRIEDMGQASCDHPVENLIANGDFAFATACWKTFAFPERPVIQNIWLGDSGAAYQAEFTTDGAVGLDETWHVLLQEGLPLEVGKFYQLSFEATSPDGLRTGAVQFFSNNYAVQWSYANWNTDAPFSTIFGVPSGVTTDSLLQIKLARDGMGRVRISNVRLVEVQPR